MNRLDVLNQIRRVGVVAILRMDATEKVVPVADALQQGGVHVIEITMGTPGVLRLIGQIAAQRPEILVGVGSVLDAETARMALHAGAKFIVTPVTKKEIIETGHRYDAPVLSGAFTPGEILTAFEAGADVVKVFPAESLGIPYLKAVLAPMPQLQLIPTGGVTVDNVGDWLRAGAFAVGVGSTLTDKQLIAEGNYGAITERARRMIEAVQQARKG